MKTIGMNSWLALRALRAEAGPRNHRPHAWGGASVRGLALFIGVFALLNLAGGSLAGGVDANLWWIDLRRLPALVAKALILTSAFCLLAFAWKPPRAGWRRWLTLSCAALLAIAALANSVQFYTLLARGTLTTRFPIPLSLFVAAGLVSICVSFQRPGVFERHAYVSTLIKGSLGAWVRVGVVCCVCAVLFPLLQMFCFGKTDYRRPADVAVVLGARVYVDGRPSDALADRVRTACELYQSGLVHRLLFSGGPGDGNITEPEAMKRMAIGLGVKPQDILLDDHGLNTQATVNNSIPLLSQLHFHRVLVVSHFYHLPRIKLSYQRAGAEVYTVPAKESYLLRQMPFNIAREVVALWVYYLRGVC